MAILTKITSILDLSRVPRETEPLETRGRRGRVLPEHVDLGLRLTVGEGVLKKPFLESSHGDGHFPNQMQGTVLVYSKCQFLSISQYIYKLLI